MTNLLTRQNAVVSLSDWEITMPLELAQAAGPYCSLVKQASILSEEDLHKLERLLESTWRSHGWQRWFYPQLGDRINRKRIEPLHTKLAPQNLR